MEQWVELNEWAKNSGQLTLIKLISCLSKLLLCNNVITYLGKIISSAAAEVTVRLSYKSYLTCKHTSGKNTKYIRKTSRRQHWIYIWRCIHWSPLGSDKKWVLTECKDCNFIHSEKRSKQPCWPVAEVLAVALA